jgi:hypothetical protein
LPCPIPSACWAETFTFSEEWVTNITGLAVAAICSLGSLAGVPLCNRYSRRRIYLATGIGGAVFIAGLMVTGHTFTAFVIGVLGYSFVQGINYTAFGAGSLNW